jgi:type II secretory pathway component PulJ
LVAGVISLIAVSGMVLVMATTLGTATQTIELSRLSQEMRTAMQIMTRELRRANYHPGFIACYGDTGCLDLEVGGVKLSTKIKRIQIGDNVGTDDCLMFWYDRPQTGTVVALNDEPVSAFRRAENDSVGRIQMIGRSADATCNSNAGWVDITDPNVIDVLAFTVDNADVDYPSIEEVFNAAGDTQNVEKIGLTIIAKLRADDSVRQWLQDSVNATRQLDEFVLVRNNVTAAAVVVP